MAREGNLEAPTRHPLDWNDAGFWDETRLEAELERVFEICHGCRRCISLCNAFPTLFDLIDNASTMEVDGVAKSDYAKVVEHCYLCDLCYQTKCPYVPPHEWNVDFPHLMLRAKAVHFKKHGVPLKARILSSTTTVGRLASIPVVAEVVNAVNASGVGRTLLDKTLGVHPEAVVPEYHSRTARKRLKHARATGPAAPAGRTQGKVAIFATCYCDVSLPQVVEDLHAVLTHNDIPTRMVMQEVCCGMPKLELGDLDSVRACKERNIPVLAALAREGFDLLAPIPSCVLMFKQELPLMFADDADVLLVKQRFFDPFEYLMQRQQAGLLKTDFKNTLGTIAWQVACHQRVQNIGPKTREVLNLVPGTQITTIERCSGHDGTYGVKRATYPIARKIGKPVQTRVEQAAPQHFTSDCPMAGAHIAHGLGGTLHAEHPVSLLRLAYGI